MKQHSKTSYLIIFALLWTLGSALALEPAHGIQDPHYELSASQQTSKSSEADLYKLLAELDLLRQKRLKMESSQDPLGVESDDHEKTTSACSIALSLYKVVGKNVIQAAHKLHITLGSHVAHTYLKTVLTDLFTRAKNKKDGFSYARIPQELAQNERFCAHLKQSMSGTQVRINEIPDHAIPALKELHKQLHYYSWLEALNNTQKAYCTRPFYSEPYKGLSENLQLIIWSMIHDNDN